ncbi:uncharacterized protein V6R79_014721 [Siganus canaliculatus]
MADVNELYDTMMEQLSNEVMSDTDEAEDEPENFSSHEEVDFDDLPTFLLSYVEASKSRATIIENHILKEPDEFTASLHTEDAMNLPIEPQYYTMNVTEQVFCDRETEKCNASTDSCLLPTPTEAEALFNHSNRGEDEKHSISDILLAEEEDKMSDEDVAEQLKQCCESIKMEERRRQTEKDFQKELRIIMETEKLHQKELELMERRAQEKLEKEFLLQQEMISNLQRRVEKERRMKEEELKRIKDEEDKRKREEENMKIEAERKRMEKEARRKAEEEERRKIEMIKVKKEAERKREEEERRRKEREEMRRRGEEEGRRRNDEVAMMKENVKNTKELGRIKVEVEKENEKRKNEEERKKIEEESKELDKKQKEMRESEGDMDIKKEEGCHKEDEKDRKKREEKNIKTERERKVTDEIHERMKQETREEREEDKSDARKQMISDNMHGDVMTEKKRENELEEWKKKEDVDKKTEEEEVAGKRVKERVKVEVKQAIKKQEEKNRKINAELSFIEDGNQKKKGEENCRKLELREEKEECRGPDVGVTTRQKEEKREGEPDRRNMEAATNEEDAGTNKKEQVRLDEQEEINAVQDREMRTNEMPEQTECDGIFDANEKNNMEKTENSSPVIAEVQQEQQDLAKTSSQKDYGHPPARSSSLSEHIEKKRLSWMKDCIPYTKLSLLQSRRKREASTQSRRGPRRRTAEAQSLPPLCLDSLLQSSGWNSLQDVTTVSLQDLASCNLSTLAQCTQLQSLSLRRCGLTSLEGINQLSQLCYVDAQENDISFVDCENMTSLRVLQLSHNKLTSIHGLAGVENLNVLDLSHNFITRIAGLESAKRLQRLLLDHNQLISTKGLRDVSTLLHLSCSHNHLASVEGLESSALLHTLDLRANSLTEPPGLNTQVLLRELNLDDNSISSLQGLASCWLPLLQRLSAAENRITQLQSLSETVSLESLDLRFNCLSEPQNVCESLQGCHFLREVHLVGNPLQQESSWRSTLQEAVPGLRTINDWQTDSPLSPPAVHEVASSSGSFLGFCQAQLQQTADLQQRHSRELSEASSSLDAVQTSCRHLSETLQLATEQRFAHERGDTTVVKHEVASKLAPEETLDMDSTTAVKRPDPEGPGKPSSSNGDNIQHNCWTFEEKPAAESQHDTSDRAAADPTWPTISKVYCAGSEPSTRKRETEIAPASNHQDQDINNTAAVVIQQLWRKYRQKCGNISSPSTAEKEGGGRGDGAEPKSGPSYINGSVVGQDYAATVIQALWRGYSLRRRLTSALAAVTRPDAGEDDTFEEVDVDEFVFDEAALEKQWTLPLCDDLPSRRLPASEQPLSLKPFSEPPPPMERRSKQAWVSDEQVGCDGHRSRSPAFASAASGLSEKSEKILEEWGFAHSQTALQMLKRAQHMKSRKHTQKKLVPSLPVRTFYYQSNPEETRNTQTTQIQHNRKHGKAREAETTERLQQERAQRWLHVHPLHSDGGSVSEHFLPEISSDVLNGGRVQLMADPGYTEHLHHASGLWASSGLAARPRAENNRPGRNSLGRAQEAPSPEQVTSSPSKKERISFRDNPVHLSGGWGGGKKRDRVRK